MLDLGFFDDIMKLKSASQGSADCDVFGYNALKIQQLAITILHNPEEITIAISRPLTASYSRPTSVTTHRKSTS